LLDCKDTKSKQYFNVWKAIHPDPYAHPNRI